MKIGGAGEGIAWGLESLRGRRDPKALEAAAREMEALLAYEMVKAMRTTVSGPQGSKGFGNDVYATLFDMELGRLVAERGLGLRKILVGQLGKGTLGPADLPAEKKPAAFPVSGGKVPESSPPRGDGPDTTTHPAGFGGFGGTAAPSIPAAGRVSSRFGVRKDPFSGRPVFHAGVDIAAPEGTPIHPVAPGTVIASGPKAGFGNVVEIDHGAGLVTRYGHNSVNFVRPGDRVGPETVIALVGSTGRSTGPHLHFELKRGNASIDPGPLLAGPSKETGRSSDNPFDGILPGEGGA